MVRHLNNCPSTKDRLLKKSMVGQYKCRCCTLVTCEKKLFQKHIFFEHNDIEIIGAYNQSIAQLLGKWALVRLRRPLITKMITNELKLFISKMVEPEGW